MGANVWPVDAVAGAPSFTGRLLRQLVGAWAINTSRPLCPSSGVIAGTPNSIATATSSTWTVTPFKGVIDGEAAAAAGGYSFSFDTNQTGSVTAADATNPRIDLLYVRVSDPAEGDGTPAPIIELLYTAGTPAATPATPATPARSMALATILVPHTGGGSPSVSFVAPYSVAAGGIQPVAAGVRPAAPYVGQWIDDQGLYRWNGSNWAAPDGWVGGESTYVGSSPTAGARKIRYAGTTIYTTNGFGQFAVNFPTAFPNGLVTLLFAPGNIAANLASTIAIPGPNTTLAVGVGTAKNTSGSLITSLAIQVNWIAEGW